MKPAAALCAAAVLSGCVVAPVSVERASVPLRMAQPASVPAGMQYLYGSGEAVAASRQAYAALLGYVTDRVRPLEAIRGARSAGARPARATRLSVVLAPGATLAAPRMTDCGGKPPAIVLDVDETVLLNTGYEYSDARGGLAYDAARWERWEQAGGRATQAVPGAVEALNAVRALGVAVIFNTNRAAANASFTQAAIERAGLGPARHGDTLFLKGDTPGGSAKDPRRAAIAARYCVIAMAGDQFGDFSDLFNVGLSPAQRRAVASAPGFARLWGNGWFILPNPVYGPALAGSFDEVFPNDLRWSDPGASKE